VQSFRGDGDGVGRSEGDGNLGFKKPQETLDF
jgi:hypothetical protein